METRNEWGLTSAEMMLMQKMGLNPEKMFKNKAWNLITKTQCITCNSVVEAWFQMLPQCDGSFVSSPIDSRPTEFKETITKVKTCPKCSEYFTNMEHDALVRYTIRLLNKNPGGTF